jgi:hypothetical protein
MHIFKKVLESANNDTELFNSGADPEVQLLGYGVRGRETPSPKGMALTLKNCRKLMASGVFLECV